MSREETSKYFFLQHLGGDGLNSCLKTEKIQTQKGISTHSRNFDVQNNCCNNNNNNDDDNGSCCLQATETKAHVERPFSLRHENNNNKKKIPHPLLVRSLSDGAKSKSNFLRNDYTQEGGQFSSWIDLQAALKSLTLTTNAFKSQSDSQLFCCSTHADGERRKVAVNKNEKEQNCYLTEKVGVAGSKIQMKGSVKSAVDSENECHRQYFCRQDILSTDNGDVVVVSNDDEMEDEYDSVVVLCSDQLKCPNTDRHGSLGSSASLELDSGRASDTGTLGQSSTTSGCSSTSSSSTSEGVRIVSHSFCDFIGVTSKKKTRCLEEDSSFCSLSPTSTGGSSGASSSSYYYFGERQSVVLFDADALRANKVSVFVPYSTLLRNKREQPRTERETSVDGDEEEREELEREKQLLHQQLEQQQLLQQHLQHQQLLQDHPEEPEPEEDNVFICGDTHVILRINGSQEISSQNAIKEKACSEANENDVSLVREASLVARKSKIYSKRMTKKLINAAQLENNEAEGSFVSHSSNDGDDLSERGHHNRLPRPPPISPKIIVRKCQSVTPTSSQDNLSIVTSSQSEIKVKSANNNDDNKSAEDKVEPINGHLSAAQQPVRRKDLCKLLGLNNDTNSVPESMVAQKVALLHTVKNVEKDESKLSGEITEPVKRKNLAKFLGVETVEGSEEVTSHQNQDRESSKERKLFARDSLSRSMSSVGDGSMSSKGNRGRSKRLLPSYWGHLVRSWRDGAGSSTNGDQDGFDDIEMEVPVQLLQLPSHEGERTNRKDLSKFLGLDDSDGEEIVFIQTKPPQNFRHLQRTNVEEEVHFEDRSLSKSRSFSSSSLRLTSSTGHNTIDQFLRTSMRRTEAPDWLGSLGKASLKRVLKSAVEERQCEDFDPPPRKSVLFKEYAFSVQESIATGLPIIPFVTQSSSTFGERKRKKDAAKRTAEILSTKKSSSNNQHSGTSLEALLRIANEEWMRENNDESSPGILDTSLDTSEASSTSVASTVKKASVPSSLVTLDRRGQAPTRMAVHPRVLEASKTFGSHRSSTSTISSCHNINNNNNNSDTPDKKVNVHRASVVFGPTSHRWIPRRESSHQDAVMVQYPPVPYLMRPAQFYAAMPMPQPQSYVPGMPPRMAMYPESGRVKLVRRNAGRQLIHSGDYVDMRQGKLLKAKTNDFES